MHAQSSAVRQIEYDNCMTFLWLHFGSWRCGILQLNMADHLAGHIFSEHAPNMHILACNYLGYCGALSEGMQPALTH